MCRSFIGWKIVIKINHGKWGTQSESWSKWVTTQSYLHCLINRFNKAIELRMSCRTRNEFGIQFPHQRLPNFANKAGYQSNTMTYGTPWSREQWSIKRVIALFSGDFLWHKRKCAISDGKQQSRIVVKWNSELVVNSVTKSIPTISQE